MQTLEMLATILKSPRATQTTIAIVETFAKMRELSKSISLLSEAKEEKQQKALMQKSGELLMDILGDETTFELNLAFMKFKRYRQTRQKNISKMKADLIASICLIIQKEDF